MPSKYFKKGRLRQKDNLLDQTRKKLGITQAQLGAVFGLSRTYITLVEGKQRNLNPVVNMLLANMYLQFHKLETGIQANDRSLETRLFLNALYTKELPIMRELETKCRIKLAGLSAQLQTMKETARDSENAIIVFTTAIKSMQEDAIPGEKSRLMITGLELFRQRAYKRLLTCCETAQAKLQAKITALEGEARVLRRYRLKIIKEHLPSAGKEPAAK